VTDSTAPAKAGEVTRTGDVPVPIRPEVVEAYEAMIADVPEAGGDGFDGILAQLALAADVAALDAPWRSGGLEEWANVPLGILGIRKMPSDYPGGLPWFLVVDAAAIDSGEKVTFTTGAVGVVAQLVKAHQLGAFPLVVIPRQSARPTASGYFPQHLEIVRRQPAREAAGS
jgi:hypothetical protein